MLTIHGRINSINVQKVVLACVELGLPFERHDAGGVFGKVKTPEFLTMNPNGLVPVLIDGDVVLWESNAIVRYLGAQYGEGRIWPTDPAQRAYSDRWMDWAAFSLYPAYAKAFMGLIRTPEDKRNAAEIEASLESTRPLIRMLDRTLEGRAALVGDIPTIGDLALLPSVFRWLHMPVEHEPTPHLTRWCEGLAARTGYNQALTLPIT